MAVFLIVQTEADLRWINLDNVKVIESRVSSPNLTKVTFVDGNTTEFDVPIEQFLGGKRVNW